LYFDEHGETIVNIVCSLIDSMPYVTLPYTDGVILTAEAPLTPDPFKEYPLLKEICTCESRLSHYEKDGKTVLRGKINKYDIGICQINELYHKERIEALGLDIYTPEGNVEFAKDLFDRQGSAPWVWSEGCWG